MSTEEIWDIALQQLKNAFIVSNKWCQQLRADDPINLFGRGWEHGTTILEEFMPSWFQSWFKHENWERSLLCGDFESWITVVQAFGIDFDDWCTAMKFFVVGHMRLHGVTLESYVKPAVAMNLANCLNGGVVVLPEKSKVNRPPVYF